jgi:exoribonuclease R
MPSSAPQAASRATTVYLVGRRIDMLPKPLTEDICSLRGGVERLAFSVLWEMTPDASGWRCCWCCCTCDDCVKHHVCQCEHW